MSKKSTKHKSVNTNIKAESKKTKSQSYLKQYFLTLYLLTTLTLYIAAVVNYIEIRFFQDWFILAVWPLLGTWVFLKDFVWEIFANDTVIPLGVGWMFVGFFATWIIALVTQFKLRKTWILIASILLGLTFIGGCTYMTAALSPFGLQ